ncbi:MAG: VanZ family protein [Proteobacteria bacterium]|nr:VanZ family protein [Pseudomonadota bacterium]
MNQNRRTWLRPLRYIRLWVVLGWMQVLMVFYLSLMRHPPEVVSAPFSDKIYHLLAYIGLMLWFAQIHRPARYWRIALGFILMGVAIEFLQRASGYRSFEAADIAADSLGVLIALGLARTRLRDVLDGLERRFLSVRGDG